MEKLAKYLSEKNISHYEFAKKAGISAPTVKRIITGEQFNLSISTMKKINDATGGKISFHDFLASYPSAVNE